MRRDRAKKSMALEGTGRGKRVGLTENSDLNLG